MSFGGLVLTKKGINLQGRVQTGKILKFTRIGIGNGDISGPIVNVEVMANEVKSLPITKFKSMLDGKVTVGTVLSNQDITNGFYWKEVGIYALDPDNNIEILYCYGYAQAAEYIPAGSNSADVIEKIVDLIIVVGTGANITASIEKSLIYETIAESDSKINIVQTDINNHKNDKNNPHNVTKSQVGLGNLDNFQQATKAEFNSHVGNKTNPHNVTSEQINKTAYRAASIPGTLYPKGVTVSSTSTGVQDGYPYDLCIITTINDDVNRIFQYAVLSDAGANKVSFRNYRDAEKKWSGWSEIETTAGAQAKADVAKNDAINFVKTFGIGAVGKPIDNLDLNGLDKESGFYKGGNLQNGPKPQGYVIVDVYDAVSCVQIFLDTNLSGNMYMRQKLVGNWGNWIQIETTSGAQAKADAAKNTAIDFAKNFGLGTVSNNSLTDMNSLDSNTPTGFYMTDSVTANKPISGTGGAIIHINRQNRPVQYYIDYSTSRFFTRSYNGSSWFAWAESETVTGAQNKANTAETNAKNASLPIAGGTLTGYLELAQKGIYPKLAAKNATDSITTYPTGLTITSLAGQTGYPDSYGVVVTFYESVSRNFQIHQQKNTGTLSFRTWHDGNSAWTAWSTIETTTGAQSKANIAEINAKNASVAKTGDSISGDLSITSQNNGLSFTSVSSGSTPANKTAGNAVTGGSDYAGLSKLNNIAVQTWYGFSVSPTISGQAVAQGVPAFSVNARVGDVYAKGDMYAKGDKKIWHAGNVGSGSGLDADKVDGKDFTDIQSDSQAKVDALKAITQNYKLTQDDGTGKVIADTGINNAKQTGEYYCLNVNDAPMPNMWGHLRVSVIGTGVIQEFTHDVSSRKYMRNFVNTTGQWTPWVELAQITDSGWQYLFITNGGGQPVVVNIGY
ncbi:pyocin knob domain-containing protein [Niallia sp. 03190]|uniref:pyocin knob domain-containing protein n=1 Tax=Niallia sp. 03190 TaxID=3458061 RepID=UPI004043E0E3